MRYFSFYMLGRLAMFAVAAGVLYLIGLRSFYLVFAAMALSVPLSVVLLRRPRRALAGDIEARVERAQAHRRDIRSALRGEDDGPAASSE